MSTAALDDPDCRRIILKLSHRVMNRNPSLDPHEIESIAWDALWRAGDMAPGDVIRYAAACFWNGVRTHVRDEEVRRRRIKIDHYQSESLPNVAGRDVEIGRADEVAIYVEMLPEDVRRMLWMRYRDDMTKDEIGRVVGMAPTQVSQRINEALARLGELMGVARKPKRRTNEYRGISYIKHRDRWLANIRIEGRKRFLGFFKTAEEAAKAWDRALRASGGPRGKRTYNFPADYEFELEESA